MIQLDIIKESFLSIGALMALIPILVIIVVSILILTLLKINNSEMSEDLSTVCFVISAIIFLLSIALPFVYLYNLTHNEYRIAKTYVQVEEISNINGNNYVILLNKNNKYQIDDKEDEDYTGEYRKSFNIKMSDNIKEGDKVVLYSEKFEDRRKLVDDKDDFVKLDDLKNNKVTLIIEKEK